MTIDFSKFLNFDPSQVKTTGIDYAKGEAPWEKGPDVVQWRDPQTGLRCLIRRHSGWQHLCGYVQVPCAHPLYSKTKHRIEGMRVHGGVTFDRKRPRERYMRRGRWVGFDTAHFMDYSPGMVATFLEHDISTSVYKNTTYRDMEYVRANVTSLAQQLGPTRPL